VTCSVSRDSHGTTYDIPAAEAAKSPKGGRMFHGLPAVCVWWSRNLKPSEETLIIRQEYEDRSTADVLELTLGQAYDLIDALNKAVEST
jgi:hypothetical protein